SAELAGQITAFESRMAGITENAKVQAVKHIARRTDEMARASQTAQVRAMEEAAQALFRAEVGPAIQRLVVPSQHLAQLAQRSARPSEGWLTHAATAVLSAAGSAWLVYLLIGR